MKKWKYFVFAALILWLGGSSAYAQTNNTHVPDAITLDKTKAVGEIPFTSGVASNGAMTYNVPIEVYPGIRGFQPQLSLAYNHLAGNGVVGIGWNIGGLSSISRVPKNIYYNGQVQGIMRNKTDDFVLDGMRLIKLSETSTQIKYETEQGNIKVNATVSGDVINLFEVLYPNGTKGIYGYKSILVNHLSYPLVTMTDLWGNTINYEYYWVDNHWRILKIKYANASVEFQYTSRPDVISTWEAGLNVVEDQYLQTIACKFGSTTLRTYTLTYQQEKGISALSQLDYSASGSSLNPLKFYYGEGNTATAYTKSDVQLTRYWNFQQPEQIKVVKGKFTYGTADEGFIAFPNKEPYCSIKSGSKNLFINGYAYNDTLFLYNNSAYPDPPLILQTGWDFIDVLCADIDGQQEEEVIKINNTMFNFSDEILFTVYSKNSITGLAYKYTRIFDFNTPITTEVSLSIHPKYYYTGDFNGDGKMEVLAISCDKPWGRTDILSKCYLFDLENDSKLYEGSEIPLYIDFPTNGSANYENSDRIYIMDYDGDGKSDICHINNEGMNIYSFTVSGSTYSLTKIATYTGLKKSDLKNRTLLAGELNGDGKTDFLLSPPTTSSSDHTWAIYYSMGNGQFSKTTCQSAYNYADAKFYLHDVNGDGLTDLIRTHSNQFMTYMAENGVIASSGSSSTSYADKSILIPTNTGNYMYHSQLLFLRKDGKVDKYTYPRNDTGEKLLTGVASSLGVVNKNYYSMLCRATGSYDKGTGASFPYDNFQGPLYALFRNSTYFNGQESNYQYYHYTNAVVHKQGLGFCGFKQVMSVDKQGRTTIKIFKPYDFSLLESEDSPLATTTYTYAKSVASNKIRKITLSGTRTQDKLKGTTTTVSYDYDAYGNPTSQTINYGDGIAESISNSYVNNMDESNYLLGFLRDQTRNHIRNGNLVTERIYLADYTKGLPLVKRQYYNGYQVFSENFTYDTQGNCTQQGIQSYSAVDTLKTKYEYDSYGRLTKETDPLGLSKTYAYNTSNGRISSTQNHKQQTTMYGYDALGQVTSVSYPDGTNKAISYSWTAGGTNGLYCIASSATGQPNSKMYYDALGRETRSSMTQFNGTLAHTDKLYDSYGRLQKVSLPFTGTSATYWNTYAYDSYNRITSLTYASGKKDLYSYSGKSITTTKEGIASTQTFDVLGNLTQVVDPAGTITYNLRPDGQPSSITAPGSVTTNFGYDAYGRQTSITDPSAGSKSFGYDPAGNLRAQRDANGKMTTMTYDPYNRLISKTCPEFATTYVYNSENQLMSETTDNGTEKTYTYDTYGRLSSEKENDTFQKSYGYSNGILTATTYIVDGAAVITEYHTYSNGTLSEIKLNGTTSIWKLNAVNAFGQPTNVTTGAITREYTYNAYGMPTGRKAGSFQNFAYDFAPASGNLSSRRDNIKGRTENFTYDNLNRLLTYAGTSAQYDVKGNITQLGDMGGLAYAVSGKPYALSGVTPISNAAVRVPDRDQAVTYTSFDRPASIVESDRDVSFDYNGSGERVSMCLSQRVAAGGNSLGVGTVTTDILTREYFLGCYESDRKIRSERMQSTIQGTKEKLYLGGDFYSAPAVYVKENGGNWNIYYICRDYLGSITHITNSSGSVVQELSYDAWGRLRNPNTQVVYAPGSEPELFLGRGYTGHEHLTQFGLVNMNARLYDPAVGRFLSPDPYVQAPDFSQSFNRYSYCLNNPLKYTDESGELFLFTAMFEWTKTFCKIVINPGNFREHLRNFDPTRTGTKTNNALKIDAGWVNHSAKKWFYWDTNVKWYEWGLQLGTKMFGGETIQSMIGSTISHTENLLGNVEKVGYYEDRTIVRTTENSLFRDFYLAISLGAYINGQNIAMGPNDTGHNVTLFMHEFGHTYQSRTVGYLYLLKYGIPSAIFADKSEADADARAFRKFGVWPHGQVRKKNPMKWGELFPPVWSFMWIWN